MLLSQSGEIPTDPYDRLPGEVREAIDSPFGLPVGITEDAVRRLLEELEGLTDEELLDRQRRVDRQARGFEVVASAQKEAADVVRPMEAIVPGARAVANRLERNAGLNRTKAQQLRFEARLIGVVLRRRAALPQ